ncbi:MAG: hypothetical protein ACM3KE_10785 [Hyphomicrobiales bacterium]
MDWNVEFSLALMTMASFGKAHVLAFAKITRNSSALSPKPSNAVFTVITIAFFGS